MISKTVFYIVATGLRNKHNVKYGAGACTCTPPPLLTAFVKDLSSLVRLCTMIHGASMSWKISPKLFQRWSH